MLVASSIVPGNRFVLRSAAQFELKIEARENSAKHSLPESMLLSGRVMAIYPTISPDRRSPGPVSS